MSGHDETLWLARVRRLIEAGVDEVDAGTRARLAAARRAALARGAGRREAVVLPWAAAAAALAGWLALSVWLPVTGPRPAGVPALAELDAVEPVELIEDLDFYAWLATQAPGNDGHG